MTLRKISFQKGLRSPDSDKMITENTNLVYTKLNATDDVMIVRSRDFHETL